MYPTKQIEPLDSEIGEAWSRDLPATSSREIHGVEASRWRADTPWRWQVTVSAMEFVRAAPLEPVLRRLIIEALRAVPGVLQAEEEDREVWVIRGEPRGGALVDAVAAVVDASAAEIEKQVRG